MSDLSCRNCGYYRQHYAFDKRRIFRVYCGHCTLLKAKRKKPDSNICEHFVFTEPDECAFATKEYLSKELLRYLLNLELLPEIRNPEEPETKK